VEDREVAELKGLFRSMAKTIDPDSTYWIYPMAFCSMAASVWVVGSVLPQSIIGHRRKIGVVRRFSIRTNAFGVISTKQLSLRPTG